MAFIIVCAFLLQRLLTSAVNYLNQLRKDVARTHVRDSAMVNLSK
ncbi:hypothetical protein E2C01_100354 [Portunus trituberculatus]|uniref:Uncharacterized protein n=1 Tax=Portunus trituberculatus TaxID=210409 RepID=A0A5B7KCV4_PORTR|nr:hypothetical protein [Portunus trituberculatus]